MSRKALKASLSDFSGLRDNIVKLRCMGNSQDYIAKTLNISAHQVKKILDSEMRERFANREDIKNQTALTLDYLARPLLQRFDQTSDRRDAEVILKILDRKCRLLGLDEPTRIEVKEVEQLTDEELEKELARHDIKIKQLPEATSPSPLPPILSSAEDTIPDAEIVTPEPPSGETYYPTKES